MNELQYQHPWGMAASLSAAALWAIATHLYGLAGGRIGPLQLNLAKGCIAVVVLGGVLLFMGMLLPPVPLKVYWLLLASGAIGIGIGDTAFFASLNRIGARQTVLLFEAAAPLLTMSLAIVLLGEELPRSALAGTLTVLVGVVIVLSDSRRDGRGKLAITPIGVACAILAAVCQAVGAVLTKLAFAEAECSAVWSAMVRLVGATLLLAPAVWLFGSRRRPHWDTKLGSIVLVATLVGTVFGISLLQTAFKYTYTATAQALAGTVSLFVLALSVYLGQHVSRQAWLGTAIAVAGVLWLFLGDRLQAMWY